MTGKVVSLSTGKTVDEMKKINIEEIVKMIEEADPEELIIIGSGPNRNFVYSNGITMSKMVSTLELTKTFLILEGLTE